MRSYTLLLAFFIPFLNACQTYLTQKPEEQLAEFRDTVRAAAYDGDNFYLLTDRYDVQFERKLGSQVLQWFTSSIRWPGWGDQTYALPASLEIYKNNSVLYRREYIHFSKYCSHANCVIVEQKEFNQKYGAEMKKAIKKMDKLVADSDGYLQRKDDELSYSIKEIKPLRGRLVKLQDRETLLKQYRIACDCFRLPIKLTIGENSPPELEKVKFSTEYQPISFIFE